MKSIILSLLTLAIFTSCGHSSFLSKSKGLKENVFSHESMSRYGKHDLKEMIMQENLQLKSLGQCYLGKYEAGLKTLKSSLNENLIDERYWNSIGVCYYLKKEFKKAAFFYKLSLQIAQSNSRTFSLPYNNLAIIYVHTRQHQLAYEFFTKAIQLNRKAIVARYNLGQFYLKKNLPKKAIIILEELIKKSPKDIELLNSLGLSYLLVGDIKNATSMFSRLPKWALKRQDIASYIALTYYLSGEYQKVLEALNGQEVKGLRGFRKMNKKLRTLANANIEQRG